MKIPVSLLRLVSAAAVALPVLAQAAGLGRLTVQSYLGQPLRAEIEIVSLQPGEESSLEAQLASGNAFAQAGIDFNAALNTMRFAIDKRGGKPVILVTTRQPVNEPFLDVLVELRWSTGLFVREYTVLLDPPGYEGPKPQPSAGASGAAESPPSKPVAQAAAPVTAAAGAAAESPSTPMTSQITPAPRVEERPMASAAETKPEATPRPAEEKPAPAPAPAATAPSAAGAVAAPPPAPQGSQTYEVKKGDTLGEIALRYRPAGVTYHQMLIALQRANEDAFIRNNINLVRAGKILTIPDAESAAAVEPADASRLVFAQFADFAEYRGRLAGTVAAAPAAPEPPEQSAAGPITAKPQAPKPPAAGDQLKLSRADGNKPGSATAKAARGDDLAARERALQEAQSRVSELEKNVADLQKLLEIRNQQLAQLQEKAAAKPPAGAPAATTKAPEPPKSAPAPQAAMAPEAKPAAPTPAPQAAKPAPEAPKPAPTPPAQVAQAPKPAPVAPAAQPMAAPKPPAQSAKPKPRPMAPPPPEPSLLDELLEDPLYAAGGGGLLIALLGGYGYFAWQRKKKSVAKFKDSVLGTASLAPGAAADSAGPASASQTSVTQSTAGGVDADDVDPIAEADVYMAYGRDAQAEEILRESLQRDPNRLAVQAKLLEIYANRRDAQSFEQAALKLKGTTGGTGPEWDKAMALGRSIDPGNGLYGGAGETTPVPVPAFAAAVAGAPAVDFDIGGTPSEPVTKAPSIDLDISGPASAPPPAERSDFSPGGTLIIDSEDSKAAASGLDFDLGGAGDKSPEPAAGSGLDFELPSSGSAPAAGSSAGGLDFDLNLGGGQESKEAAPPALDLSAISLDLGASTDSPAGGGNGGDPKWQEVATKLDLAKAYEEMGDRDGARELLNEVLREGDSAQQGQANQLLAKLG